MSQNLLCTGSIASVKFAVSGADTAIEDSCVTVISHEMLRGDDPYPYGVYDARLGTSGNYRCQTCNNGKNTCIGHEGDIKLAYPVINPIAMEEIPKWLKAICHNCGESMIAEEKYLKFPKKSRLDKMPSEPKGKSKKCKKCDNYHPYVKRDDNSKFLFVAEVLKTGEKFAEKTILYPHHIAKIFSRISDETVIKFGKPIESHPRNFIVDVIKVPAVSIRPDVRKLSGGQTNNDDITTLLQDIIKKNSIMPRDIPAVISEKLGAAITDLSEQYFRLVRDSGEKSVNSIVNRLKGKGGRFRKNQMGKRLRNICRSTITGDPTLPIDVVRIPLVFAQKIQIEDVMQEYNKHILMKLVRNGPVYPGASKIRKRLTGVEYDIVPGYDIDVEIGDTVIRDVLDGDDVGFNRAPSLGPSSIGAHKVLVTRDPKIRTIMMNVIDCKLYDADFDGDTMVLIFATGIGARHELSEMSKVANWFISHTSAAPAIGEADDSIIGSAELTRSGVMLSKYHAMMLFRNCTVMPSFADVGQDGISGRGCVTKLLEYTPINFTRQATFFKTDLAPYMNYDPTETRVVIDQGKLVQGVLDKDSIGAGARGGIFHLIANEYSNDAAFEAIFNLQQLAIGHVLHSGFTVGIMDVLISAESQREIDMKSSDMINKSRVITEKLNNGEIIPPIGKTVEETFEEQQINTLKVYDDFIEPIMKSINPATNNMHKMIVHGSKGKPENLFNMVSNGGQKLINGERIVQKFGFKRTLPFYPRFDTSPESRGYIANSYLVGMNSAEYIFNAMACRFDLISKALTTSVAGYQTRKSVLTMQEIVVNNFLWVVKNKSILQFTYGEDGLDSRKIERVKFPTALCSDAVMAQYAHKDYPEFFAEMQRDREKYRACFGQLELMNVNELMSDERGVAVNVERTIGDILRDHRDALSAPTSESLARMVKTVTAYIDNLPYIFTNETQAAAKVSIPMYAAAAVWPMQMLIRTHLCPVKLIAGKIIEPVLNVILQKITLRYSQALIEPGTAVGIIAAQSFTRPLTQYMLDAHQRSATGGTSTNVVDQVADVLGAKATESLSSATMLIPVLPQYQSDRAKVQEIANNIEVMRFGQFVTSWQIFYEKFGEPVHPRYAGETALIDQFQRQNPLMKVPGDLTRWCIRFSLSKSTLILKNMSMELIINRLRIVYPNMYIVYTAENSRELIIRVYTRGVMFKTAATVRDVSALKNAMFEVIIRGVEGIMNARVIKMIRNKNAADGSVVRDDNIYGITTDGTNLQGILCNKYVDRSRVHTSAIAEMCSVFGVEAGVQKIISSMRGIVQTDYRHYLQHAIEMSHSGHISGIEIGGLKKRDANNILLRMGFGNSFATIKEAAVNGMEDSAGGIAQFLIGSVPKQGTLYNSYAVNEKFVAENISRPDDVIADALL